MATVFGVLGLAAGVALVVSGAAVRRRMERDGMLHGAGLLPAGAANEGG